MKETLITLVSAAVILLAGMKVHAAAPVVTPPTKLPSGKTKISECNYPDTIRDGLHPFQYYGLAKRYLTRFDLERAQICVQKLRLNKSNKDAKILADRLEDALLPKYPLPKDAYAKFTEAINSKFHQKAIPTCEELVKQFPNCEWLYLVLADKYPFFSEDKFPERAEILKQVLKSNPHNVQALVGLAAIAERTNKLEEAWEYYQQAGKCFPEVTDDPSYCVVEERIKKAKSNATPPGRGLAQRMTPGSVIKVEPKREVHYQFIDKTGKTAVRIGPNTTTSEQYSNGLLLINGSDFDGRGQHEEIQYWDTNGDLIFSVERADAISARDDLCAVNREWSHDTPARWGFYNLKGEVAIAGRFSNVRPFNDGMAEATITDISDLQIWPFDYGFNGWGFIDKTGKWRCEPIYLNTHSFAEGLAPVALNRKIGYLNKNGAYAIDPKFDLARPFSEGLANVTILDERMRTWTEQYIDKTGKVAFSEVTKLPGTTPLRKYCDQNELCGFASHNFSYTDPNADLRKWDFHEGLVVARVGKLYGYKNRVGKIVIAPKFESAYEFYGGLAKVSLNKKFGFINKEGKLVIPAEYQKANSFAEGLAAVSADGKVWGFIDKNGKTVIEHKFVEAFSFADGLAKVGFY